MKKKTKKIILITAGVCRKEDVLSLLAQKHTEVLVVLGAGDLDNYAPQITQLLSEKYHG